MITILYVPHWLEFIPEYQTYLDNADVIILEDPNNPFFQDMLKGKIDIDEYIQMLKEKTYSLSPAFPKYTRELCKLLRRYDGEGKKIHLIEPYHELLEKIYEYISGEEELGKKPHEIVDELMVDNKLKGVYMCERMHYKSLLDYYTIVNKDFDEAVEAMIRFSKVDAYKILIRDRLRGEAIYKFISGDRDSNVLIEAGDVHIPLYAYLGKMLGYKSVKAVHILHKVSKRLGIKVFNRISVQLTLIHLYWNECDPDYERLLAARNVVRLMLVSKDELEPSPVNPYPRLTQEAAIHNYISRLGYEDCKRMYYRLKNPPTNFSSFRFK